MGQREAPVTAPYATEYEVPLGGEIGIAYLVLVQATNDLYGHLCTEEDMEDARRFFRGRWYRFLIGSLGLPEDWLPAPEGYPDAGPLVRSDWAWRLYKNKWKLAKEYSRVQKSTAEEE